MNRTTPADIQFLLSSHQQFQENVKDNSDFYQQLAQGQSPKILLITCCDSRIDLHALFNCQAGDLFIIRNVANLVPPFAGTEAHLSTKAGIEYAVKFLKVEHIIILGHSGCGGIQARHDCNFKNHQTDFIEQWVNPAIKTTHRHYQFQATPNQTEATNREQSSIIDSLNHLFQYPWVNELIEQGALQVHGWHYDIGSGSIQQYQADTQIFTPLS